MKQITWIFLLAVLLSGITSCNRHSIPKPDQLISKSKFEKMMVDIYLIQGLNNLSRDKTSLKKLTQTDLYFSVLKKYSVADTVFVRSLIYYSSFPKEYEKMHVDIMNMLNQAQDQFRPVDKLKTKEE